MPNASAIALIESKFNALVGDLDERGRRRWAATEAMALGRGGITTVSLATGLSDRTIRTGIQELSSDLPLTSGRQRRTGGGRKPLEHSQPALVEAIESLVEPTERGDPQSPLRWTCKSLSNLQRELRSQGHQVGRTPDPVLSRPAREALGARRAAGGRARAAQGRDLSGQDGRRRHRCQCATDRPLPRTADR